MSDVRILYVDDEQDLVQIASTFFEDEGMPIDSCTSLNEALEKIRSARYDIIISDSRMPSGTGRELFTTIQSEGIFTGKFILVTGNLDFDIENEKGLYDLVIYKPLKFQELVDRVKEMLLVKI